MQGSLGLRSLPKATKDIEHKMKNMSLLGNALLCVCLRFSKIYECGSASLSDAVVIF